jgi:hypothetical protein
MNEAILKFAATFKVAATSVDEDVAEDRAAATFLGYVLGDPGAIVAKPPEYTPLQTILRGLRSALLMRVAPFCLHKIGDGLYAHATDTNDVRFSELHRCWADMRQALWLSAPNAPVKMLDAVAVEDAFHLLFDLIFNDYFIEEVDEDVLKAFHKYADVAKEMAYDNMGDIGLQGDAAEEFVEQRTRAFNTLMFICEKEATAEPVKMMDAK